MVSKKSVIAALMNLLLTVHFWIKMFQCPSFLCKKDLSLNPHAHAITKKNFPCLSRKSVLDLFSEVLK